MAELCILLFGGVTADKTGEVVKMRLRCLHPQRVNFSSRGRPSYLGDIPLGGFSGDGPGCLATAAQASLEQQQELFISVPSIFFFFKKTISIV